MAKSIYLESDVELYKESLQDSCSELLNNLKGTIGNEETTYKIDGIQYKSDEVIYLNKISLNLSISKLKSVISEFEKFFK